MNFLSVGISLSVMLHSVLFDRTLFSIFLTVLGLYLAMNCLRQAKETNSVKRRIQSIWWNSLGNPTVFGKQEMDITESEKFLDNVNKQRSKEKIEYVVLFAKAIGTAFEKSKKLCGQTSFGQFILKSSSNITIFVHTDGEYHGRILLEDCSNLSISELNMQYHAKVTQLKFQNEKDLLQKPTWVDYIPSVIVQTIMILSTWISYDLGMAVPFLGMNSDHYGYAAISDISSYNVTDFTGAPSSIMKSIFVATLNAPIKRAVYINGELTIRKILNFNLAYDHRFGDGTDAIKLLQEMNEVIDNPEAHL
jgi:hypothetical protein